MENHQVKIGLKNNGENLQNGGGQISMEVRCKNCNCLCHCSLQNHSDMLGICPCQSCNCGSQGHIVDSTNECETCQ